MTALDNRCLTDMVGYQASQIQISQTHVHGIDYNPLYAPASLLGDHSVCDPPDPIPNSAVKPVCADGTIAQALEE